MRHLRILLLLAAFLLSVSPGFSQQKSSTGILPDGFSDAAFTHVAYLAGLGHRQVGTENDRRAIQYIKNQFEAMNMEVEVQPVEFDSFEYTQARLVVGNKTWNVSGIGLNPFKYDKEYQGTPLVIDLRQAEIPYAPQETEGKTIITNDWNGHFRLFSYKPGLIIYLEPSDFEKIKALPDLRCRLDIEGGFKKYRSANIIARVGKRTPSSKEIIVSAHFDTYGQDNPGASDNASGVGVLLELARHFKEIESALGGTVKFIAFGAEEIGAVGSRSYLEHNGSSLQDCELLFNIDNVGGNASPVIEIDGGVSGMPEKKAASQIPDTLKTCSWEGINSKWRLMDGDLAKIMGMSNHPQWLVDVVHKSLEDLRYSFRTARNLGSDQFVFTQAGIVACGLGIMNRDSHTAQDVPEKINKNSLKIAGEITARVVMNSLKRLNEK